MHVKWDASLWETESDMWSGILVGYVNKTEEGGESWHCYVFYPKALETSQDGPDLEKWWHLTKEKLYHHPGTDGAGTTASCSFWWHVFHEHKAVFWKTVQQRLKLFAAVCVSPGYSVSCYQGVTYQWHCLDQETDTFLVLATRVAVS